MEWEEGIMISDICVLKKVDDKESSMIWKVGTMAMILGVIISGIIIWKRRGLVVCLNTNGLSWCVIVSH